MEYRVVLKILIVVSIFGFIGGIILSSPQSFGLCAGDQIYCFDPYDEIIGQPLGFFSVVLFLITLILLFTKQAVFHLWLKFAIPYLILVTLLLAVAPTSNADIYGLDRELIAWFTSALFLIISLLIIGIKSWKLRG